MKNDQKQIPSLSNGLWTPNTQPISYTGGPENREQIIERYTRERDLSKVSVLPPRPELNPFDTHQKKRVVIYCRVSTDGLSQATSFVLQKRYYLKYVQKRPDWQLIAIYSDEGLTATQTRKRIGLLKMLQDAKNGLFDMYDDHLTIYSPSGMADGSKIQERDIMNVDPTCRNPVLANVFKILGYMNCCGGGMKKIIEAYRETENYCEKYEPKFCSNPSSFEVTFFNLNYNK